MSEQNTDMVERYTFRVEWSEEDGLHIASCLEFPSVHAHGKNSGAALKEIKKALLHSIEWMKENGEDIPIPIGSRKFKGNLTLRVPPAVHRQLYVKAAEEKVSVNQYILSRILM
jgi:predicted HicB family RNase H-like nuclease